MDAVAHNAPKPFWVETFEKIVSEILTYPHKDQVEFLKLLRETVIDERNKRQANLEKELESFAMDVKYHAEGTLVIAKAI